MIKFISIECEWSQSINERFAKVDKSFFFELTPKILPLGENTLHINCTDTTIKLDGEFLILIFPYYDYDYKPFEIYRDKILRVKADNSALSFSYNFESEQMYSILVGEETETGISLLFKNYVYALADDMFSLKPLIGDLHCHTVHSDGLETAEGVLKAAIKHNFDFIAITDHNCYEGSKEAKKLQHQFNYPITVINGEEYSSSFTNMHIISLGADSPLDESNYIYEKIDENSAASAFELTKNLCVRIANNGGVSVMCHPLWKPFQRDGTRGDVPLSLVKQLMEAHIFDAIEVVGGSPDGDNMTSHLQALWAMSFGATPDKTAYVGTTDSHIYSIDPICGKHFTMVFAEENTQEAIKEAIRQKRTVAIQLVDERNALCFGTPRLCMFAMFYLDLTKRIEHYSY